MESKGQRSRGNQREEHQQQARGEQQQHHMRKVAQTLLVALEKENLPMANTRATLAEGLHKSCREDPCPGWA